ncbi:helix-turn-helix transcriptional regulator [Apibacter raozihei]|uniref:helix-turn-helix domain-containing protein n=1 Tax=Apibacter raozihei TaxID=2500547 RepID=UPI000FE319CD|nr:helix-turn-helix transcriptional regulator [Apibacter raozihei]
MIKPDSNIHHGRNIKRIRELLGYKQEFLAIELDITQQFISEIERKEVINKKTLKKIADILQVPVEAIENLNDKKIVDFTNEFIKNVINNNEKVSEGKVIKYIREYLNIPVKEIALKLGISEQEILELENKKILDKETLTKIAEALHIPVEAIENFNDEGALNFVANTFNNHDNSSTITYQPTFNPIDKIVELYTEKEALYERMIQEKNTLIEKLLSK